MSMKKIAMSALLLCVGAIGSLAQESKITGQVTDPGGATIASAQLQLTNTNTNATKSVNSSDDGSYVFPALPAGPYKLEVKKEGFQTYVQTGITLDINTNPTINVLMKIGNIQQTVEVQADAAMVETQTVAVGQVVKPEEIVDLPLNGRQATQLIALAGAAIVNTSGGINSNLDYPSSVSFSVAGSQGNETNYALDGSPNMDYRTNIGSPLPFPDALQEFKVESSSLPASTGSRAGGAVGAITKSGTNQVHGNLFDFFRNGIMNADSFQFGATSGVVRPGVQDNLKRNQFGGVIGGPIKKDKLFYFYGIQVTPERSSTAGTRTGMPTAATEAGDFRAFLAPPCQASQVFLNNTIPSPISGQPAQQLTTAPNSNIILPQWLNTPSAQISKKIWSLIPTPSDACGTVFTLTRNINNEYQQVARLDWERTPKDALFARYFIADYALTPFYTVGNLLSASAVGLSDRVQNVAIGDTKTISNSMINSLRLTMVRTATQRTSNDQIPNLCSMGTLATCPLDHHLNYLLNVPGFLGYDFENAYGISENLGWIKGAHTMSIGFTFEHVQMNADGLFQVNPGPSSATGSNSYSGQSLADFIIGSPYTFGQGNGQIAREGQNFPALFFQDNWRLTHRFQVNLGLRWDPYYPQHDGYRYLSTFNLADFLANKSDTKVFSNSPPGMSYPGDAGFNGNSVTRNHAAQFAPRIGIVIDPTGKGDMSLRAGYGLNYGSTLMWNAMHVVLNPPYGGTLSFNPLPVNVSASSALGGGGVANPFFNFVGGNPFPTPEPPPANFTFPVNGQYVFQNTNLVPPKTQSWNVSLQRQVTKNWLVTATYIGNRTTDIWLGQNLNQAQIISAGMTAPGIVSTSAMTGTSGPCTLLYGTRQVTFPTCNSTATVSGVSNRLARGVLNLANPAWGPQIGGGVTMSSNLGYSNYNGLLISAQHRMSEGVSVLANYTWSHCLDLAEGGQDLTNNFQNPQNPGGDYGNCGQDRRQLVNVSLVLQSPRLHNIWLDRLVGGWNTSQIFTAASGAPFNMTDGTDISLTNINSDRPNVVGNPFAPGPVAANPTCVAPTALGTLAAWINRCAFQKQAAGTYGNEGRNNLFGPGTWNVDGSIWKTFRVNERYRADLRFEAFNLFNHANWGNPSTSLNSGVPGFITTAANTQRILQVALKISY